MHIWKIRIIHWMFIYIIRFIVQRTKNKYCYIDTVILIYEPFFIKKGLFFYLFIIEFVLANLKAHKI